MKKIGATNVKIIITFLSIGIIIGAVAVHFISQKNYSTQNQQAPDQNNKANQQSQQTEQQNNNQNNQQSSNQRYAPGCEGTGSVRFISAIQKMEDIDIIQPMGLMVGGHVTPIDHGYYYPPNWTDKATINNIHDVYSPASGVVTGVQSMPKEYSHSDIGDYRITIHHTCTFYTIYIHINQLAPKLQEIVDIRTSHEPVRIEAGELIGKANSFDFSAHNDEITLPGFIVPEHYAWESWKIHTVDPYDYYDEPLKSRLLAKIVRTAYPRGGKIDYDIDGKLIGNWFKENTGGYSGNKHGEYGYWSTHLAIVPDTLDPSHIIVSLGEFKGEAQQFGIKGNSPNPATVSKESNLIKYELVPYGYIVTATNQGWDNKHFAGPVTAKNTDDQIRGTILLQLTEERKLKLEIFPDKTSSQVSGFTSNAQIYER